MVCLIFRHARVQHPAQYTFEFMSPASPDHNGVSFIALSYVEAEMWTIVILSKIWCFEFFAMHVCSTQPNTHLNLYFLHLLITTVLFSLLYLT